MFRWRAGGVVVALLFVSSAALAIITSGATGDGGASSNSRMAAPEQLDSSGITRRANTFSTVSPSATALSENSGENAREPESTRSTTPTPASRPAQLTPTTVPAPEPTPLPQVGRAQLATFAPSQIRIPALEVEARIVSVGVNDSGAMEAPEDFAEVGWYQHGATPGMPGRAVMAGHVDSHTGPAIFYRLQDLEPGDEIIVRSGPGARELRFVVRESHSYEADTAPVDQIFGDSEREELILITCGGPFDWEQERYLERHVVYAELQPADQASHAP